MPRSHGFRRGTRKLLKKSRGMRPLSHFLYTYSSEDNVVVDIDPAQVKGMPHRRFQGKVGVVKEVGRRSLVIDIPIGRKIKRISARLEHLRPFKGAH